MNRVISFADEQFLTNASRDRNHHSPRLNRSLLVHY
jgi:hypothetical protein